MASGAGGLEGIQAQVDDLVDVLADKAREHLDDLPDVDDLHNRADAAQATGEAFRRRGGVSRAQADRIAKMQKAKRTSIVALAVFAVIAAVALVGLLVGHSVPTVKAMLAANKLIVPMNATLISVASAAALTSGFFAQNAINEL